MKPDSIRGTFAPVPTPFDEQGAIDLAALGRHLGWLQERGLEGALVLGSNGEFPSLTLRERRSVAEAAARSGLRLILNVGSCSLPEVLELVHIGGELGYGALLCPPPFYLKAPPTGVASFLLEVLDAARLPVLLYNIPQRTGISLDDRLLDLLDGHPNLAGVKDSSGDPAELQRLSRRFATRSYLVGSDRLLGACRAAGGSGSITAAANVVPELVRAVWDDPGLQPELDQIRGLLEQFGLVPGAKALLRRAGLGPFRVRLPLTDLPAEDEEHLVRALQAAAPGSMFER